MICHFDTIPSDELSDIPYDLCHATLSWLEG